MAGRRQPPRQAACAGRLLWQEVLMAGGGQVDAFLKLVGPNGPLKGESNDAQFPDLIEIDDWDLSAAGIGTPESDSDSGDDDDEDEGKKKGKKGEKGKEKKEKKKKKKEKKGSFTFKITKDPDYSSPDLAQSYSQNLAGERECFPRAELYCRKRGAKNFIYLTLIFKQVYVVAYNLDLGGGKGGDSGSIGEEKVEFVFETCIMKYASQGVGGEAGRDLEMGWDFKLQEKVSS